MEPYILTQDDIARLLEQGFDMRGVSAGAEATSAEAAILSGGAPAQPTLPSSPPTMSTLPYVPGEDDGVMRTLPYDPSTAPSTVMPMSSRTPAPVTFAEADGTTSTAPSASAIPQSLPAAAAPGTTMVPTGSNTPLPDQPRGFSGFLSGLTGMFGGQGNTAGSFNPAANAGIAQPTDPFEGLSRNQRMMLGFAALRDAAASLEGRDTSFFNDQLGQYESARDRERLRVQGVMQNRAQAITSLLPVFQKMQEHRDAGEEIPDYLRQIVAQTYAAFGMGDPSAIAAMPTGVSTLPTAPTEAGATGAAGAPEGTPASQPTPMNRADQLRAENQADQELLRNASSDAARERIQARIDSRNTEIAQLEGETAAATEAANLTMPTIQTALDYLIEDFDENGQPILRRELMYRIGRATLDATQPPEYMQYLGAIRTLKSSILIEGLQQATFGALSSTEQAAVEALQGSLDPSDPIGSYETLMRLRDLTQQIIDRHSENQGGGSEAPASSGSGRINWNG
jgi:hypothetical protein